jgi:plastocyanin
VGSLSLEPSRGAAVGPDELAEAIVYFVPDQISDKPSALRREVVTRNKRFEPSTLVVPVGSIVVFPNRDVVLHNVFSLSPDAEFDLGLYGPGENREIRLDRAAVVRVHCNVHHSMQTDIVVVDTPYFTQVPADGRFRLGELPRGPGTLHLWHPRAQPTSVKLTLPIDRPLALALVATKPRVPAHTNKDGDSYRAALER